VVAYAPTLVCSKKSLLALSYSVLDAARHPSQGGCWTLSETQENANRGTVVAQSKGVNRVALVFGTMLTARTNGPEWGVSRRQLLQQRLRVLQIARVKALSEPPVHRSKQFASLLHTALVTPEAGEAHGGAVFP
jgi:hypothetical protein